MDKNEQISTFIASLPADHYASETEKAYFSQYSECGFDMIDLREYIWGKINERYRNLTFAGNREEPSVVNILHLNTTNGGLLEHAPLNSEITAWTLNYICKRITDFRCQDRARYGKYYSQIRHLADYFALGHTNTNDKYDIVLCEPHPDEMVYVRIVDKEGFKNTQARKSGYYYLKRGKEFVAKNGLLVIQAPKLENTLLFGDFEKHKEPGLKPLYKYEGDNKNLYGVLIYEKL